MKNNLVRHEEICRGSTAAVLSEFEPSDVAALEVLRATGIDVLEAALVAKEALVAGRGRVKRARECISAGAEALRAREKTVTFERAVEAALEERSDRRKRTVMDFRYICKRLMKRCKGLAKRRVRSITPQECAGYLRERSVHRGSGTRHG